MIEMQELVWMLTLSMERTQDVQYAVENCCMQASDDNGMDNSRVVLRSVYTIARLYSPREYVR